MQHQEDRSRLNFNGKTLVMGIINVTPDSFAGDGLLQEDKAFVDSAIEKAHRFISAGADILDIGGESTRPGATPLSEEEELQRVIPVIQAIRQRHSIPISVDTTKAAVARAGLAVGATILNDVSGLMADSEMADIAAEFEVPLILMHNGWLIENSTKSPHDIIEQVAQFLEKQATHAMSKGVMQHQIILDPGIGFGKTLEQNLLLLKHLDQLKALGYPVLLGASRKVFIEHITGITVDKRLPASIAAATIGVLNGADIIRVHDVEETVQALSIVNAVQKVTKDGRPL